MSNSCGIVSCLQLLSIEILLRILRQVYTTAKQCDEGNADQRACCASILFAAESATEVAVQAIQALGGNGYINEYPTGRLLRDAKLYEIGAGTSEIRRMVIGRSLVKEQL